MQMWTSLSFKSDPPPPTLLINNDLSIKMYLVGLIIIATHKDCHKRHSVVMVILAT